MSGDLHQGDCGADAAAYVLGALEPAEANAFRAHLESCAVCRDEVSAFGAVVDVLPLGAPPQTAPRALKRRVMATVRTEARAAEPRPAPRRGWATGWLPRPALAGAVGALAAAAVVVVLALSGGGGSTRVIQASTTVPGSRATLRITGGHGELVMERMPAPPPGKVYEVWLARPSAAPAPTNALFSVTSQGAAQVDVPGNLHGVSQVMVTPEPEGGSRVPTHAPVLVANL